MSELKAVILDIDGTLLDSNEAHAQAFVDAGRELGREVDFHEVLRRIGKGGDKLIPEVFGVEKDSPEGSEIDDRKGEIFRERYLPRLQPTPGARELLLRMLDQGLTLTVATSASGDELHGLLERAGVDDLISDSKTTSASDVDGSKPEPDVVEAALEKAGCGPDQAVMLGDTPYDVEASTRAGVRILAVRTGGWEDEDLRGAVAVYQDPADILRHYDDTPLGRGAGGS